MAAATFKVELKDKPNADGTTAVRIRITRNRRHAYLNLGIRIRISGDERKSEWNTKHDYRRANWIRGHRLSHTYNQEIQHALDRLEALGKAHPTATAKEIKQHYERAATPAVLPEGGFVNFMRQLEARHRSSGRIDYAEQFRYTLRSLLAFAAPNTEDAHLLTPGFAAGYEAWLRRQTRKHSDVRRYSPKTIKIYISALRVAFEQGVQEGALPPARNPFAGLDLYVPPKKQARPVADTILSLFDADLSDKPEWHQARNTFLLLFLLHGGRVAEVLKLEWGKVTDQYVSYLPGKKAAKWKTVPRNEMINRILHQYPQGRRYVLPWLPDTFSILPAEEQHFMVKEAKDRINTALLGISRRMKIGRLTTHMARRTFTDTALKALKDIREVQHLVGWASVSTAERYAEEMRQEELDAASSSILAHLGKH